MTNEKRIEELKEIALKMLVNDGDLFVDLIEALDSWNGFGDGFRAYNMWDIDEFYYNCTASKLLKDLTEDFNINDGYFFFSIYGLESTDDILSHYLDHTTYEEVLDSTIDNYYNIAIDTTEFSQVIQEICELE